jgi:acyl-CoA synthetase (AMP-forming)/AMP-acid ligase II
MSAALYDAVAAVAERQPDVRAVTDVGGDATSYRDLTQLADRLAGGLHDRGVRAGDTVALALPNSTRYVALILAMAKLGARYVPLMRDFDARETTRALDAAAPVLLVSGRAHHATSAVPTTTLDELAASAPRAQGAVSADTHVFRLLWTSGSTGFPKMTAWRQDRFVAERHRWLADTGMRASDVYYCRHPLDVAHATDLHVFAALLSGARVVLADPDRPAEDHLDRLAAERATVMSALPLHYARLVTAARLRGPVDLSALRRPLCGGAYLSPDVVRDADAVLGIRIRQIYGSTEFGLALGNMADEVQSHLGMRPVEGVGARLVGFASGPRDVGELVLRSDATSEGYPHADSANARAFRDGEFWTGDVAERLPSGELRILGRVTEALATPTGPLPAPVLDAEVAAAVPGSEAVSLLLAPGAYTNQVLVALWLPDGAEPAQAVECVADLLAAQGLEGTVRVVDAIPRTPVGKTDKPQLRARFALEGAR